MNRKKEAKKEIVSYFLLTEKGRPYVNGKNFDCGAKNLKKINPVGAPKVSLKEELEAAKKRESQLKQNIRDTRKSKDQNLNDDQNENKLRNFEEFNISTKSVDIQNRRPSGSMPGFMTYHTTMSPNRQSTDDGRVFRANPDLEISVGDTPKVKQNRCLQVLQEESDSQGHLKEESDSQSHSSAGNNLGKTENKKQAIAKNNNNNPQLKILARLPPKIAVGGQNVNFSETTKKLDLKKCDLTMPRDTGIDFKRKATRVKTTNEFMQANSIKKIKRDRKMMMKALITAVNPHHSLKIQSHSNRSLNLNSVGAPRAALVPGDFGANPLIWKSTRDSYCARHQSATFQEFPTVVNDDKRTSKEKMESRAKIKYLMREFLLKFPEARTIFLGETQTQKIIDSPRLLKKRMEVYIAKRQDRFEAIGNIMTMAKGTLKKFKPIEKKRKKVVDSRFDYLSHFPGAKKMHQSILSEEFDIFDLIWAREHLTNDLVKFLLKFNDPEVINSF